MEIYIRPSKTFLFHLLKNNLSSIKGEVGLDAAAAGFKNRRMFKTEKYYGLDLNSSLLKDSVKNTDPNAYGIAADLVNLDRLPSDSVDAVVSTNTLYNLAGEKRLKAISDLIRLTAPQGIFFCELPIEDDLPVVFKLFKNNFSKIKIIYYKNFISNFYESFFETNGFLGAHPLAGRKPFLALSYLISRVEYLTGCSKALNRYMIIIASGKKGSGVKNNFDLTGLPKLEERIYNILS